MSTPIKRLEIIKNAIELEDDDIIQSQLTRLKNEAFDDELQAIVVALEQKNYTAAMAAITAWLQSQRAITQWRDPGGGQQAGAEGAGRASARSDRSPQCAGAAVDEFNDLYFSRLGPLMQQILALRKTLAELNLRRQQAEARRREEDYRRCQQYMAQAVEYWQRSPSAGAICLPIPCKPLKHANICSSK
jgi:hypothetical protein